jgi:repressor of nif and glnA expression
MNTRDFILVGAGAVVGYLLVGVMNKKNSVSNETTGATSLTDTSSLTVPPISTKSKSDTSVTSVVKGGETLVDPNLAVCKENWVKFSKNKRFRSEEERQSTYDKFMENCLIRT